MGYNDDLNLFASQNPGDSYASPNSGAIQPGRDSDPMAASAAGVDQVKAPAPAYSGLTGDPYQTALITTAQLEALSPRKRPVRRAPRPLTPFAGLSSFLGA